MAIFGTQTVVDIFYQYANWMWRGGPSSQTKNIGNAFQCNIRSKDSDTTFGTGTGVTKKLAKENAGMH